MTDVNGNPRTASSSDATQLMRPLAPDQPSFDSPAMPDLPKASFGGYAPRAVEDYVAKLQNVIAVNSRALEETRRAVASLQTKVGALTQQNRDLIELNDRLKHDAENPMEALGKLDQDFVNNAKAQANDIRARVRAEAEQHVKDANDRAAKTLADAERQAQDTVQQALGRKTQLESEGAKTLADAKAKAENIIGDAQAQAQRIVGEARGVADQLDADVKKRVAEADRREANADRAVDETRRTLTNLLKGLDA